MKRLLIILLALVVSGCSTRLEGLDDLAFVGMQFDERSHTAGEEIRIDLSTAHDFQGERIRTGGHTIMNAAFCRQTEEEFYFHRFFYFHLGDVWRWDGKFIDLNKRIPEAPNTLHIYSVFISERSYGEEDVHADSDGFFLQNYDLQKNPEDICVRFKMTYGMQFKIPKYSKIVRIPKEEFIKLFASHPQ
jgi:hypothetical protein